MTNRLAQFISAHNKMIESALERWLPLSSKTGAERFNQAVRYAVFPGGKRLRPMLTLIGAKLAGGDWQQALPAACAMEFLHTSSLILDDLPAMDDADVRRGRSSVHLVYGESTAMLAALALLNQSYALLAQSTHHNPELTHGLILEATECIGPEGMIGGQAIDLELRSATIGEEALTNRNLKTTALMRLTMTAGALSCGATEADVSALAQYGENLGAAYQVCDDLLDELGETELIGKPARQDERHLRPSIVAEFGVEGAYNLAMSLAEDSKQAITRQFGFRPEALLLLDAVEFVIRDVETFGVNAQLAA
ncbi:MAG: polyprenyl synthetase family protein [Acidobacteria bacterium]|nr:polyprenyl synthetase family protein [Acidobacteriota bacterium]